MLNLLAIDEIKVKLRPLLLKKSIKSTFLSRFSLHFFFHVIMFNSIKNVFNKTEINAEQEKRKSMLLSICRYVTERLITETLFFLNSTHHLPSNSYP